MGVSSPLVALPSTLTLPKSFLGSFAARCRGELCWSCFGLYPLSFFCTCIIYHTAIYCFISNVLGHHTLIFFSRSSGLVFPSGCRVNCYSSINLLVDDWGYLSGLGQISCKFKPTGELWRSLTLFSCIIGSLAKYSMLHCLTGSWVPVCSYLLETSLYSVKYATTHYISSGWLWETSLAWEGREMTFASLNLVVDSDFDSQRMLLQEKIKPTNEVQNSLLPNGCM